MEHDLTSAAASALALGAVLATTAVAATLLHINDRWPSVAVAAIAGVGAALGSRLAPGLAPAVVVAVLIAVGALAGLVMLALRTSAPAAGGEVLPDLAGLGLVVALVAAVGTGTTLPWAAFPGMTQLGLARGPLGAIPTMPAAVAMVVLAAIAVTVLARWHGGELSAVLVAGAAVALVAGVGQLATMPSLPFGAPVDAVGLAVRGFAAGLAGRGDPWDAAAAGLGLGFAEALVVVVDPSGSWALLPTVALFLLALATAARDRRRVALHRAATPRHYGTSL